MNDLDLVKANLKADKKLNAPWPKQVEDLIAEIEQLRLCVADRDEVIFKKNLALSFYADANTWPFPQTTYQTALIEMDSKENERRPGQRARIALALSVKL